MKQKLRKVLILVFILLVLLTAFFVFRACTIDKQKIYLEYSSNVYTDNNLEAIVSLIDKNGNTKKGSISLVLLNSDGKKVKGIKEKYKVNEGEVANCSINIPEELEAGNYKLRVNAKSGLLFTKKEVNVNISNSNSSDIIISLDKGIYKPGDTIKYQALVISKNDNTPKESKDISVEILDGNGNKVYTKNAKTSEFGIISGEFALASEVNSGKYTITTSLNSKKVNKNFTVNPYVVPQFEVTINNDKEIYQVEDTATITFNAKYFFGEPVVNANVVGKIGKEDFKGLTDNEGNFIYTYKMDNKGEYDIEVSVTDTSNYLIESSKTLYAQEYPFEVETLFENGCINKNMDNNVYLFAKKIDGTPVKVHATINIGNINRQVITDENGIGKFTLTSNDTSSFIDNANYKITATDNEGNTYSKSDTIVVNSESIAISTDKVKYNQGDDITINLNSIIDSGSRTIYVCKNDEVKKIYSTDNDNITLNLEDLSGLVDIFVEGKSNNTKFDYSRTSINYPYYYNSPYFARKTIFIKPSKSLDIAISTDKEEYKPSENMNLSFKVQDENNSNPDANLLVSILDEAVLNLASNDLSIDNIRLALKDIDLTDNITAADLYADVLDNQSESKLVLALLKRNVSNPDINKDNNFEGYKYQYEEKIALSIFGLVITVLIYTALSDSKKFKTVIMDMINVVIICIILVAFYADEYYYSDSFKPLILIFILTLMIYCLVLYKKRDLLFNLVRSLIVLPGIYLVILYLVYTALSLNNDFYLAVDSDEFLLYGALLIPIIMTILIVISRNKKLNKFFNRVKELTMNLTKIGISYFISYLLTEMTFDNLICFVILLLIIYLIFDKIYRAKILKEEPSSKPLNVGEIVIAFFFGVILIMGLVGIGKYSSNISPQYDDYGYRDFDQPLYTNSMTKGSSGRSISDGFDLSAPSFDSFQGDGISESGSRSSGVLNIVEDIIDSSKKSVKEDVQVEEYNDIAYEDVSDESISDNQEKTEKVRNVFLESLAFIPDLVANNGNASTKIQLSDNITTWNIQVVGNTKNGSIGSNSKTFKVFKEFFIDFSLPSNSIVTDKTNIPVTVYNYKNEPLTVNLNVVQNDWSTIGNYTQSVSVDAGSTKMIYLPLEILKAGNNTLRIEASANGVSDIVEKTFAVTPNGYKKSNVVSSATIEKSFSTDFFTTEEAIENTRKLKLKIYPSAISQAIDGMENIFRMPTGCFEQTSSSLYPNILALKYLEDNGLDNEEVREKALEYISSGYQRILTFEVPGTKGGYSLYGRSPAEPVLTAFGLMELTDAKEVYDIDDNVISNMKDYLYSVQKVNGSFNIGSTYIGGASSESDLAMNAYIIWALSEADPDDDRINKSIEYLENKINDAQDNYTLALMANAFTNVKNKNSSSVIKKLMENVKENGDNAYIDSNIRDYYGCYGSYQAIQTTALTSMALTKNNLHSSTNNSLVRYLISKKDVYGNWGNTQSTILALKTINMVSVKGKIAGQTIVATINNDSKEIKVDSNPLDIYELEFNNISEENKVSIDMKKGSISYELVEEYYVPYESLEVKDENQEAKKYDIEINATIDNKVKVNDTIKQVITLKNISGNDISNGLISINIPQGCTVDQNFLEMNKSLGMFEKYEYNYTTLNIYIRNFDENDSKTIEIKYRANYPEEITGGLIRAFDYYNPNVEGIKMPEKITVTE